MFLKSYGKINIGLKIINKRQDGFHNIETIFYPLNLYDEIDFHIKKWGKNYNSLKLRCDKAYIPTDKSNTCYKAIINFFKYFNIKECFNFYITINKNIPVGGGLGGGSSNAAAVIKALTRYFNINIHNNRDELLKIALAIGSDVPFFLVSKPCFAYERGDKLKLLPDFRINSKILLVNPNMHISTKWAYENNKVLISDAEESPLRKMTTFNLSKYNFENDFEVVVFDKYPELKEIKELLLKNGAHYASLSGSGATMFGLFRPENEKKLQACFKIFKDKNYLCFNS
jgi:4-diphosphocytidyl-2-C-methyl-D-erythritol kinase